MAAQKQSMTTRRMRQPNTGKIAVASKNLSTRRITAERVDHGALEDLFTLHHERLILEYERAREARQLLNNEWCVPLPPEYSDEDRQAYGSHSSAWYMLALHTTQRLSARRPDIMRPAAGISRAAQKASTGVEVFAKGLMEHRLGFPWEPWIENLQNEGAAAMLVLPSPVFWERVPTLWDEDEDEGEHLTENEYNELTTGRKAEFERYEREVEGDSSGKLQETRYKRVKERYRVDKHGDPEPDGGSEDWQFDRDESTAFYEDDRDIAVGDNPPVVFELLSRLDFVPINPRFSATGVEIDGIIARRLFARDNLRAKGYWWKGCDDALEQVSTEGGKDGDVYLYTFVGKDHKGHVFLAYQVAGAYTTKSVSPDDAGPDADVAVIDLTKKYKLSRLPAVFRYGWHWSTSDPARRSIPFIQPYASDLRNRDVLVSAMTISAMWDGMPSYGQRITPDNTPAAALNGDVDLSITIRPNSIVPIYGDLVPLGGKGVSTDVVNLIQMFEASYKEHAPAPGAFGGEGPTSGIDRQTLGKDMEIAHSHILEGGLSGYEEACSLALEICTRLGQLPGKPQVSLNVMSITPTAQPGPQSPTRSKITLSPRACGENWTVVAHYAPQPGDNLAAAAQWAGFAAPGTELILREEFRTLAMGDPSPEIFEAKRMLQRWLDTEAGMQYVMEQVTEALADERLKSILTLQSEGRMTDGQVPVAAMGDIVPAIAGTGGTPLVTPQPARPDISALAGTVGGAVQASAGGGVALTQGGMAA